jgi:hypothetical protein
VPNSELRYSPSKVPDLGKKGAMHRKGITGSTVWQYPALLLCLLGFSGLSVAANHVPATHYVWCGAKGTRTGTNWTDAYIDLPTAMTRGDVYYVAGSTSCTYGPHVFNDNLSGSTLILIAHSTALKNSGVAGWQSSFGTLPALWNTAISYGGSCNSSLWIIQQSYYMFEGEFGTIGITEPAPGSFGFHLAKSGDCVSAIYVDSRTNSAVINGITFNHVEVDGSPINVNNLSNGALGVFTQSAGAQPSFSGMSLYEDYFHDWETGFLQLISPTNLTVDHSWFSRTMYNAKGHGNGVAINPNINQYASNLVFSNDTWEDTCGTSVITFMNGSISDVSIYGNTFFQNTNTMTFPGAQHPVFCNGDGQIGDLGSGGAISTRVRIYNNTFYDGSGSTGILFSNPNASNIMQINNLFVNNQNVTLTVACSRCAENHNTIINQNLNFAFTCKGGGDSCQGSSKPFNSARVTSNVADVVINAGHGLSLGDPVLVIGSQTSPTAPCGIDTHYPYPRVSEVVSRTEFKYDVQQPVSNAICEAGYGAVFSSPVIQPFSSTDAKTFTLSGEKVVAHLNDGTTLPAPYTVDPLKLTRGADGTWERGAYEFE